MYLRAHQRPRRSTVDGRQKKRVQIMRRVQGLRSARNRSLLGANEDFEHKHNAEIAHNMCSLLVAARHTLNPTENLLGGD